MSPPSVRAAWLRISPERRGASPNSGFRGFWEFQGQEWGHWFGDAVEVSLHFIVSHRGKGSARP